MEAIGVVDALGPLREGLAPPKLGSRGSGDAAGSVGGAVLAGGGGVPGTARTTDCCSFLNTSFMSMAPGCWGLCSLHQLQVQSDPRLQLMHCQSLLSSGTCTIS